MPVGQFHLSACFTFLLEHDLHTAQGCFCEATIELSSCNRDIIAHNAKTVYKLMLCKKMSADPCFGMLQSCPQNCWIHTEEKDQSPVPFSPSQLGQHSDRHCGNVHAPAILHLLTVYVTTQLLHGLQICSVPYNQKPDKISNHLKQTVHYQWLNIQDFKKFHRNAFKVNLPNFTTSRTVSLLVLEVRDVILIILAKDPHSNVAHLKNRGHPLYHVLIK